VAASYVAYVEVLEVIRHLRVVKLACILMKP